MLLLLTRAIVCLCVYQIANVKVKKDPHLPKKAKSAYVWFAEETRPRLKTQFPDSKPTAISKLMGDQWNIMTQEEKAPYNQKAADDAIRFKVSLCSL